LVVWTKRKDERGVGAESEEVGGARLSGAVQRGGR
jgi:hypothetical protein